MEKRILKAVFIYVHADIGICIRTVSKVPFQVTSVNNEQFHMKACLRIHARVDVDVG